MFLITPPFRHFAVVIFLINFSSLYSQTSGPTQPEVSGFTDAKHESVDLFTGDFSYSIPIINEEGLNLSLNYQAGITMDQEASWVGLGWTLNPGAISRQVRGIPDDSNGDLSQQLHNTAPNITIGLGANAGQELFGLEKLVSFISNDSGLNAEVGAEVYYNTINGLGIKLTLGADASLNAQMGSTLTGGLGLNGAINLDSNNPTGSLASAGLGIRISHNDGIHNGSLGGDFLMNNQGQKSLTFSSSSNLIKSLDNNSYSHSFNKPSYLPTAPSAYEAGGGLFQIKLGAEITGVYPNLGGKGYWSYQKPLNKGIKDSKTYGYLYLHNATEKSSLMDFNVDKDSEISEVKRDLSIPQITYDLFNVTANGLSGVFRAHRNDIGILRDPESSSQTFNVNAGVDIGAGNLVKVAVNGGAFAGIDESRNWNVNDEYTDKFDFKHPQTTQKLYTFKFRDEITFPSESTFEKASNFENINMEFDNGIPMVLKSEIINSDASTSKKAIKVLTVDEKEQWGYSRSKQVKSYKKGVLPNMPNSYESIDRSSLYEKNHHIGEIQIMDENGFTYVFSIPVYSRATTEVTFRTNLESQDGFYVYDIFDYEGNLLKQNGDQMEIRKTSPPHATSFLLTFVLAPDYIDVNGNGPDEDDLGNYLTYQYTRIDDDFGWRTPSDKSGRSIATFQIGNRSDGRDDTASFQYGKKEIWYPHSVETKTKIILFNNSKRKDGHGLIDPEKGIYDSTSTLEKLDSIQVINKNNSSNQILRTHYLTYDYSLAQNIPSNQFGSGDETGKLSLKSLHTEYNQKSNRGSKSKFEFSYSNTNPAYEAKNVNRWGNYESILNSNHRYINQSNKAVININASAWNLNKIQTPEGKIIKAEYEADSYSYVQNRKANILYSITGIGEKPSGPWSNLLYDDNHNNYLRVQLPYSVGTSNLNYLFDGLEEIYVKVQLNPNGSDLEEIVEGFIHLDRDIDYGLIENEDDQIWIKIANPDEINPLFKIGLDKVRNEIPRLLNGENGDESFPQFPDIGDESIAETVSELGEYVVETTGELLKEFGDIGENLAYLTVPYETAYLRNICKSMNLEKSFVRLNAQPVGSKLGGGYRVKSITVSDNWSDMTNGQSTEYRIDYKYKNGVASWEPPVGSDENPFYLPVRINEDRQKKYDPVYKSEYKTLPYMEAFYPTAVVGYEEVTVEPFRRKDQLSGQGYDVSTFFTAKDFPFNVKIGHPNVDNSSGNPILQFLSKNIQDERKAAQSFTIIKNDMHGKKRKQEHYSNDNPILPITSTDYIYSDINNQGELDQSINVVNNKGEVRVEDNFGTDYDLSLLMRHHLTQSDNFQININSDWMMAGPFPFVTIVPFFSPLKETRSYKTMSLSKEINQEVILRQIIERYNGGIISNKKQLAFDEVSGRPILFSNVNKYGNEIFSLDIPAHWEYEQMRPANKYLNTTIKSVDFENGLLTNHATEFIEGDQILLRKGSEEELQMDIGWAYPVDNNLRFIDHMGNYINGDNWDIQIIRPGAQNQINESVGSVTSLTNPLENDLLTLDNILQASAKVYSNKRMIKGKFNVRNYELYDPCPNGVARENSEAINDIIWIFNYIASNNLFGFRDVLVDISINGGNLQYTRGKIDDSQYPNNLISVSTYLSYNNRLILHVNPGTIQHSMNNLHSDISLYRLSIDMNEFERYLQPSIVIQASKFASPYSNLRLKLNYFDEKEYCVTDDQGICVFKNKGIGEYWLEGLREASLDTPGITLTNKLFKDNIRIDNQNTHHVFRLNTNPGARPNELRTSIIEDSIECNSIGVNDYLDEEFLNNYLEGIKIIVPIDTQNVACKDIDSLYADLSFLLSAKPIQNKNSTLPIYCFSKEDSTRVQPFKGKLKFDVLWNFNADSPNYSSYCPENGRIDNPYKLGLRSRFGPNKSYYFLSDRNSQGVFEEFTPFWNSIGGNSNQWNWMVENTITDQHGNVLEARDRSGVTTSMIFDQNIDRPRFKAVNASQNEIAFEDFEYYLTGYENAIQCDTEPHFRLDLDGVSNKVLESVGCHTGLQCLRFSGSITIIKDIWTTNSLSRASQNPSGLNGRFQITKEDKVIPFRPTTGKYKLALWANSQMPNGYDPDFEVKIKTFDGFGNVLATTKLKQDPSIHSENNYLVHGVFEITPTTHKLSLELNSKSTTLIDDISISPIDAQIEAYIYDRSFYRLETLIDDNHMATRIKYDEEGNLEKLNVEHGFGIQTIKEVHQKRYHHD